MKNTFFILLSIVGMGFTQKVIPKLTIATAAILFSETAKAQLVDGIYKPSKITVSGGVIVSVDSIPETDPTVNPDAKTITNTDQNHWNDTYVLFRDYPSYTYLDYLINHVWIPTTSRESISVTTIGSGAATYNNTTGTINIPTPASLPTLGSAGQLLRVNAGGTAPEYFTPSYLTSNQSITISGDVSGSGSTSISTTLSNTGVSAGKYDWVQVDTKGRVTSAGNMSVPTAIASGARNFNQAYQISSTVQSSISVSSSISCNLSLSGGQSGTVTLEISANGTTGWIYIGELNASNTGTLTVGLNTTQISGGQLTADLPAGYYWRLTTTNVAGTPTFAFKGGSYITY